MESAKIFKCFVKHSNFVVFRSCVKVTVFETVNIDVDSSAYEKGENYLIYQRTNALNKMQFMTSIKISHVSTPGFHRQAVFWIKEIEGQHADLGRLVCWPYKILVHVLNCVPLSVFVGLRVNCQNCTIPAIQYSFYIH
jgi:hypothetical protein